MKKNLHLKFWISAIVFVFAMLLLLPGVFANNNINHVVVTGQITGSESGAPVENQTIIIESENTTTRSQYFYNTIKTNEEGIFTDTIFTTLKKGSFVISTNDIHGNQFESTIHFRFLKSASINTFVVDFSIDYPQEKPNFQANFRYVQKARGDRFRFKFLDLTSNSNTKRWYWDFGDGNVSALQNPDHTYHKPGLYKVKLNIQTTTDRGAETSNISRLIYISDRLYSHIGGHCFAGYFPIDEGKAYLYLKADENTLVSVDTAIIDTLGYYYFYQIPEGDYYVKAQPDKRSSAYGNTLPTYYGNEPYWEKATSINHTQTNWEYDIHLVEGKKASTGIGELSGKVSIVGGSRSQESDLASGVDIFLFDNDDNLLMSHYTNENHEFIFESLGMGTYWLAPEIAGLPLEKIKVEISNNKPSVENITFNVRHPEINIFVRESTALQFDHVGFPYPNPASNQITVDIQSESNKQVQIEILDLQGNIISSQAVNLIGGTNKSIIQTNSLKRGIYLLCIKSNDLISQKRFVISR